MTGTAKELGAGCQVLGSGFWVLGTAVGGSGFWVLAHREDTIEERQDKNRSCHHVEW
jgi:hypothetical protein